MEEWEFWLVYVYEKGSEKEQKGNERKWKGNKEKLSDPSPFNNILNNLQFLLIVVGIKHSYL